MRIAKQIRSVLSFSLLLLPFAASCGAGSQETEVTDTQPESEVSMIQSVTTSHGEMRYFRFGNSQGEPLIILPGLSLKSVMGAAEAVEGAYALLAEDYDMYLFDRITEYPEGYDVYAMADDTLEAFDQLGLKDVNVIGVSQGGMIAQIMAVTQPERFARLILCSTTPSADTINREVFDEWQAFAEKKDAAALTESFGRYVYSPDFFEQYKDAILAQAEGVTDADFRNFLISVKGTGNFDIRDRLNAVQCPVFVLGAGEDMVVGVQGSLDLMDLLGCEGYIYEGRGHGVYDEAEDYRSRILEFLKNS